MSSWQFLALAHVTYASALLLLTQVMKGREKPKWVSTVSVIHNFNMSVLSLVMLVGLILGAMWDGRFSSTTDFGCRDTPTGVVPFWMYIFFLSKMFEFVDTFLLVLSKKKLIWLHKVHHLTTMSLVWHSMVSGYSMGLVAAASNCFVHVIMYMYFAKPIRALRSAITTSQIVQFLVVIGFGLNHFYRRFVLGTPCDGTLAAESHCFFMYGTYLAMFLNFFIQQYLKKANGKGAQKNTVERKLKAY